LGPTAKPRWWLGGAINQTWIPVLLTALALMVTGWPLRALYVARNSIGVVRRHLTVRSGSQWAPSADSFQSR